MRAYLLPLALVGLPCAGHAQAALKAGNLALGAGLHYWYTSSPSAGSGPVHSLSVAPSAGLLVLNRLAVGLSAEYATYRHPALYPAGEALASTRWRVGPFATYYQPLASWVGLTGTLWAGYEHQSWPEDYLTGGATMLSNGLVASVTPGIIFFPAARFGVGASLGSLGLQAFAYHPEDGNGYRSGETVYTEARFGWSSLAFSGTYFVGR